MYTSQEEYPFAVLYFTGSKTFNTVMRGHALKIGVSLNEHGLYKKQPGKEKEEKVDATFKDEKDIFDYLKLDYKEPVDRIDARSVVIKNGAILPTAKPIFLKHATTQKISEPKPEKEKKTRKKREPKPPKSPKPPKRTYKKREKKEGVSGETNVSLKPKRKYTRKQKPEKIEGKVEELPFFNPSPKHLSNPLQEEPIIVPVVPLEIAPKAEIHLKTLKRKEPKENKTKKLLKEPKKMTSKAEAKKNIKLFKEKGISIIEGLSCKR
jgi:hypothetical protein